MTFTFTCVVCGGAVLIRQRGLVAPFIAERVWGRRPFPASLMECVACGFQFFNPRLESDEQSRLYCGYRSPEYQQQRQRTDPWYTRSFNAGLHSTEAYELRQGALALLLQGLTVKRVLDYGGYQGALVQDLIPGARAFVYDPSQVLPVEGVRSITFPEEVRADLVIVSNVLEHVPYPRDVLVDAKRFTAPGGLIFVEVPNEPFGWRRTLMRAAQVLITSIMRPRLAPSMLRPAGLCLMHEHVNFFTPFSLSALAQACDCAIVASGEYRGDMIWALLRV